MIPPIERSTGARVYVGGATASQVDFSHVLSSKLPLFIGVVIALAALLLVRRVPLARDPGAGRAS